MKLFNRNKKPVTVDMTNIHIKHISSFRGIRGGGFFATLYGKHEIKKRFKKHHIIHYPQNYTVITSYGCDFHTFAKQINRILSKI